MDWKKPSGLSSSVCPLNYFTLVFLASTIDSSLFIYLTSTVIAYLLIYVDDIILTGIDSWFFSHLVNELCSTFELKDLSPFCYFLGFKLKIL